MVISTNKYYMAQYFSVDMTAGTAGAKMIINTRSFTGVGQGLPPHIEHPLLPVFPPGDATASPRPRRGSMNGWDRSNRA